MDRLTARIFPPLWYLSIFAGVCLGGSGCDVDRAGPGGAGASHSAPAAHGHLGLLLVDPVSTPLVVEGLVPGSPASTSGIQPGDILLRVGHQRNPTHAQLQSIIEQSAPGESLGIRVARKNEELEFLVELVSSEFIEDAMLQRRQEQSEDPSAAPESSD